MHKQDERSSERKRLKFALEEIGGGPISINAPRSSLLFLIVCMLCLSPMSYAQMPHNYCAGQQYTFAAPCNDNFIYLWDASAGNNTGIDKCNFIWTAPNGVASPTEINISLLVSNRDSLSCTARDEIKIIVYPSPVVSLNFPAVHSGQVYQDPVQSGHDTVLTADSTRTFCDSQLTYQWYRDDLLIENAISPSYTATKPGKYKVIVTCSSTGCSSSATSIVTDSESPI